MVSDFLGKKTKFQQAHSRILQNDVPVCFLPPDKRRRLSNDFSQLEDFEVHVEVPLHPKSANVVHPKGLRPIALLPVLRNMLGGLVLQRAGTLLDDTGIWQFAYKM